MSNIDEYLENNMYTCEFKQHTGYDCHGCGFQRSSILLIRGDLKESVKIYPALIPFFLTVLLLLYQVVKKKEKGGYWVMYRFVTTVCIALINLVYNNFIK